MKFAQIIHPYSPVAKGTGQHGVVLPNRLKFDGARKQALETSRNRLLVTGALFVLAFMIIGGRVIQLSLNNVSVDIASNKLVHVDEILKVRADITDRNGILIATSLPTAALYANPQQILDLDEAVDKLTSVLPGLNPSKLYQLLSKNQKFVWLHRNLTPKLQFAVNALGIPGLNFQRAERRVYPHDSLVSHVVGMTDIDGKGLSGLEGYFDNRLRDRRQPLRLSLDVRIQALVRFELENAMEKFTAIGAVGIVLDVNTGEVISMVSLPDFNPNKPITAAGVAGFNRATKGVYEMGSTFKLFTSAMALDTGRVRLADRFDARKPIKISRFTISDYHAKNKWLTVPEVIVHSSNIGAAKIALEVGTNTQKRYLKRLGLLSPARIELIEVGAPLSPDLWRKINTMTISYGHGIAVSPLQLSLGVGALVNGGVLLKATLLKLGKEPKLGGISVIKGKTSQVMRDLMRLVVRQGSGKRAEVPGYFVGGKTGTANKPGKRRKGYQTRKIISSFVAAFPTNAPKYVVLALLDEPKGIKETQGLSTAGWVAAPIVQKIIRQMVPIVGMEPSTKTEKKIVPGNVLFIPPSVRSPQKLTSAHRQLSDLEKKVDELLFSTNKRRGRLVATN